MALKIEPKPATTRPREKRRGQRMNSRVPVRLEWDSQDGQRVQVDAHTRVVNPYGCMMVIKNSLELDQRVTLTNQATHNSNIAVVVWKGGQRPDGWEYGIELVSPEMDFWGLEL